jgi:tRNA U34 5-methylaminomethyl-2-thiouridine-forming methyltransferase MnmC
MPQFGRTSTLIGMMMTAWFAPTFASTPSFDPKPWLDDLEQTREAIATKYANLEWVVIEDCRSRFD